MKTKIKTHEKERERFIIAIIADAVVFAAMRRKLMANAELITGIPAELDKFPDAYATVLWYFAERHSLDYSILLDKYADSFINSFWSYEKDFDLKACIEKNLEMIIAEKIFTDWTNILKAEMSNE